VTLEPPHCQFGLSPQAQTFSPSKLQIHQRVRVSRSLSCSLTFQDFQPSRSFPLPSSLRILCFFPASLVAVSSRSRKLHPASSRFSCMGTYRTDSAPKS
jgi:hypothetical protein